MKLSWAKAVVCLLAVTAFLAVPAQAQLTVGSVTGTVVDATGAVIPGATVTLTNQATGVTREQETSSTGSFAFERVRPGAYSLRVSMSGFKTHETTVEVSIGKVSSLGNVAMQVGPTTEVVTVEAGAVPLMQAESPQITGNYSARTVADVTWGTMGIDSTAFLTAGVVPGFGNINTNTGTGGQIPSGTAPTASGQRSRSTQFSMDGHEINDISIGGPAIFLRNLDTVAEYQVTVNQFDSGQGRLPGATINIVTKSGGNDFHGSAFYFYETTGLRAQTSSEDRFDELKGKFVLQEYGGTFGGPIVKNKFFAFGSFDRYRVPNSSVFSAIGTDLAMTQASAIALAAAAPNNASIMYMNSGPFSRLDGNPQCNRPLTTFPVPGQLPIAVDACPITRSVIQSELFWEYTMRFDLVLSKQTFTGKWLHQTDNFCCDGGTSGYWEAIPFNAWSFNIGHTYQFTPRAINDFRFSAGRFFVAFEGGNTFGGSFLGGQAALDSVRANLARVNMPGGFLDFGLATNLPQGRLLYNFQWQDNFSYIWGRHTFKAGMEIRRNRTTAPFLPTVNGQYNFGSVGGNGFARFDTNEPSSINFADGPFAFQPFETDQFYYIQDDIRVRPNFTLNVGLRYEHTGQPVNTIFNETLARESSPAAFWNPAVALEDRIFPKIASDDNNWGPRIGFAYTPRFWKSLFGEDKTVIRGGYLIAYEAAFYNILLNISTAAPRVFLFSPCTTIATCGGAGFGGVQGSGTGAALAAAAAVPVGTRDPREFSRTNVSDDFHSPYAQNWSLGIQREFGSSIVGEARYVGSRQIGQFQSLNANPLFGDTLGVDIPVVIGPPPSGTLDYFSNFPGSFPAGVAPCGFPGNPFSNVPATFLGTAFRGRVHCDAGALRTRFNGALANYHGLQTRMDVRNLYNQLTTGIAFTWSKTIDNVSEIFGFFGNGSIAFSQNPFQVNDEERGESNFHLGNVYTTYWIWDSPWHRDQVGAKGKILGGWQWNGQVFLYDGRPWTPTTFLGAMSWPAGTGRNVLRGNPVFLGTCGMDTLFNTTFTGLFETCRPYPGNPDAPINTVGFVGDPNARWWLNDGSLGPAGSGRNPKIYGDGVVLSNMGFFKNTRIGAEGRYNLQFRAMFQNIFNHRNFGVPDTFIDDSPLLIPPKFLSPEQQDSSYTFGVPNKNSAVGRLFRFALRFTF